MSLQKLPHNLKMDHLFLDVLLEAIPIRGKNIVDLTGRKTFVVGMMRQNKGFGITDINIETKASLQPIVDITFKDLYGNTVFDTLNDLDTNGSQLDYSLLFDWPPPKFRFTFKGYLGRPVTWIMNLKKTNTRYNSSDGSYEIKASFVPNQWGFLSDIPFLYLLAKKRLKMDIQQKSNSTENVSSQKQTKIESIFDIIKIGKTVENKTKQISKEFDKLQKQLSVLKANSIDGLISKDFEPNDVIDGSVSGRQPIKGVKGISGQNELGDFKSITIKLPPSLSKDSSDGIKFQETLKALKADAQKTLAEHRKIIALIGGANSSGMGTLGVVPNNPSFQESVNAGVKIIDDNLKLIEVETKRRLITDSKTELGAVTISEVFSRLAADGGFILGSILDAGYTGYNDKENNVIRSKNELPNGGKLIGSFFPLTIDKETGEQIPAFEAGIRKPGCEMDFVDRFIEAISQGIAENQANQNENALSSQEGKLPARINNLEIINDNPYKDASSQQILEKILIRSGIATYLTRSYDPNRPGDYDTSAASLHADNDSAEEIKQLADKELKNITDSVLASLSSTDSNDLKDFCRFINNLLDVDGKGFQNFGTDSTVVDIPNSVSDIKKFTVYGKEIGPDKIPLGTIDEKFRRFVGQTSIFYEGQPKGNSDSINYDTFLAGYVYHNETLWMLPRGLNNDYTNDYSFVVFNNPSNRASIDSVMNNESDSEFNNKESKESNQPLGIVKLTNGSSDKSKNEDEIKRLTVINEYIGKNSVFDFSKLKGIGTIPTENINNVLYPNTSLLNNGKGVFVTEKYNESNIGNGITYTVYSQVTSDSNPYLAWGLFKKDSGTDRRGTNQRIFLRRICVDLENRINKLEDEKNNVLSQVLGKAQSSENSLYIQMHHIFHQWGIMASDSVDSGKFKDGTPKITEQQISDKPGGLAIELENAYGNIVDVENNGDSSKIVQKNNINKDSTSKISVGFRYDFPMERMIVPPLSESQRTKVEHSIINIEPLYKPNANTTLLNILQQLCTKNNFMFIPIPGNVGYTNITDIFRPSLMTKTVLGNVFHVLFTPTPESRAKENDGTPLQFEKTNFDAFEIEFGSPDNPIVKNLDVSTDDSKPTAESILNLQRLVDKDNSNKVVTTDCSTLSVMEGRSYKMKVEMLGNAQVSPMQYFYVSKMPIFSGLYQVMNVTHSIKPNDMSTTIEGVKMRFDNSNMRGIKPITIESLEALVDASTISQPSINATSPNALSLPNIFGATPPANLPSSSKDILDLIPGTYRNNNKVSISLAQINGKPVEVNTARAYLEMKKAFDAENKGKGITLSIASGFRPPYDSIDTKSNKGIKVKASSQYSLRVQYLKSGLNVGTDANPEVLLSSGPNKGTKVGVDSPLLVPQLDYFTIAVAPPGSSNHGNGIALDLSTGSRKASDHGPLDSEVYSWLIKNSWKYGFVRAVKTEEWHFEYNQNWANLGPYGGFLGNNTANVSTPDKRDSALFYTDLGLSNITI